MKIPHNLSGSFKEFFSVSTLKLAMEVVRIQQSTYRIIRIQTDTELNL